MLWNSVCTVIQDLQDILIFKRCKRPKNDICTIHIYNMYVYDIYIYNFVHIYAYTYIWKTAHNVAPFVITPFMP